MVDAELPFADKNEKKHKSKTLKFDQKINAEWSTPSSLLENKLMQNGRRRAPFCPRQLERGNLLFSRLDILIVDGKQLPRSKREVQALRPQTASPRGSAERFKKSLNTHSRHLSTYQRLS